MMMMTMTADELLRLPRGCHRYELWRGELKTMPLNGARHGSVASRVGVWLGKYVDEQRLGEVLMGTGFWLERDPDSVLGAEFAFIRTDRYVDTDHFYPGPPDLAVEVISRSNPAGAIAEKTTRWLAAGARAVIIVHCQDETVVVQRLTGPTAISDVLTVDEVIPGWQLPLSDIFA
jgi:Uma2 family endonuclease